MHNSKLIKTILARGVSKLLNNKEFETINGELFIARLK